MCARVTPEFLIEQIKTKFIRQDGLLARNFPANARTIFDNFDDLVPFFLHYGEHEFLLEQVHLIEKQGETFASLCADGGMIWTSAVDEWFGGLYALWGATGDKTAKRLLDDSVAFFENNFFDGAKLSAAFYPNSGRHAPYYEPWSAGMLETSCEMRNEYPSLFERSKNVLAFWVQNEFFREYGIFPFRVFESQIRNGWHRRCLSLFFPFERNMRPLAEGLSWLSSTKRSVKFELCGGYYSQLMKSNTTPAFCLLEFQKADGGSWKKHLSIWIESALRNFCEMQSGRYSRVYSECLPVTGMRRISSVVNAFILIDVICDSAAFLPEFRPHLSTARQIADFYWGERMPNGLLPIVDGSQISHLDHQVDFAISLRRLGELQSDKSFHLRSDELLNCAFDKHSSDHGLLTLYGPGAVPSIDPKYNALALKGFVSLGTPDQLIYGDSIRHALFKDR